MLIHSQPDVFICHASAVWHDIDADGVRDRSPLLAGKIGVMTSRGLDAVVSAIADVLKDAAPGATLSPARVSLSPGGESTRTRTHSAANPNSSARRVRRRKH